MATGMISPIMDTEEARIKDRLATAAALRKQGMSGDIGSGYQGGKVFIVGNPWGNIASAIGGELIDRNARQQMGELEQGRRTQRDEFLASMPSPEEQVEQAGPMQDGGAMPDVGRTKSPLQHAREMQQWGSKAMSIPGMEGLGGQVLQQAIGAPQREADRLEAAKARQAELDARLAAAATEKQAQRDFLEQQAATYKLTAAQQEALKQSQIDAKGGAGAGKTPKGGDPVVNATEVLEILKQADPLVTGATASGLGDIADKAAGFFGYSLPGANKAAQLKSLGGLLVSKMPRMEGPQSDKDVALYKEMAGRIGDPTVPTSQKQAAMETIREINSRYAGVEYKPNVPTVPRREAPAAAIAKLRANPALADDFKAKFGYLPE